MAQSGLALGADSPEKFVLQLKTAFRVAKQGGSWMAEQNQSNLHQVDWDALPQPEDDGGGDHLLNCPLPDLLRDATTGEPVNLSTLSGRCVVFAYPMTARPDVALPDNWDMIPGARGCTPQACSFRDLNAELKSAGADHVFGLSAQSSAYQQEAAERLHLPFALLSDSDGAMCDALNLPSMMVEGTRLLKRLTFIAEQGRITKVFYPVFPPDRSAQDVLNHLRAP